MSSDPTAKKRPENAQPPEWRGSPSQTVAWHTLPLADAFQRLECNAAIGLTQAEAAQRLAQYGPNTLAQAHQRSTLAILLAQFRRDRKSVV